jgi:hypothetical protein
MATTELLVALYTSADERLRALIQSLVSSSPTQRRKQQLLRQVEQIIAELTGQAGTQMAQLTGESYRAGASSAVSSMTQAGIAINSINETLKPLIHQRAAQAIMDEAFYSILEASDHMSADAKRRIEDVVRQANVRSLTEGVSRKQATRDAVVDLNNRGITGMVAKNGARIPVDKYMSGVVHYHQRKAHVTGQENLIVQNDLDLVYVNFVGITCEYCAVYQGRVYSISGQDKRFPKLEQRPPYHSHCVHSLSAWIEEYTPPNEVEQMVKQSNRPFADNRTEANINRYKELQRDKAKLNEDRKQFARYSAIAPDDTPKSLAAFRRMKYNNSVGWQELQGNYRKTNAYSKIVAKEPSITADLQAVSKSTGVEMVGLDFRIKSRESYLRKVSADANGTDLHAISDAIAGTNDVIRYTYQSTPSMLVDDYLSVNQSLSDKGYEQIKVKNTWLVKSNPYKGINTNYRSPDGQKFEVQFHTPESFALKNGELHSLYEKWRIMPNKAAPEAIQLSKKMSGMSSNLQIPNRIDEVK